MGCGQRTTGGLHMRNLMVVSAAAKELLWLASNGENLWASDDERLFWA